MKSPLPPVIETVEEEEDEDNKEPTQDPSSPGLTSDEDCFPAGEASEDDDSSLCSSPMWDN